MLTHRYAYQIFGPARRFSTRCGPLLNNSDPFSLDIPTVELSFEKHPSKTAQEISKLLSAKKPVPDMLKNRLHKKKPILFLHGLFGSKSNTRTVSRALARDTDRDVFCVDLRNHGDSPHTPIHTYPALAADVERFMQDHRLGPSVIVGHSMGAKAAMAVALRPRGTSLCAALVAVDNAPQNAALSPAFGKYVAALAQIEAKRLTKPADAYRVLAETEPDLAVQQFLMSNVKRVAHLPESAKRDLATRILYKAGSPVANVRVPAGRHPHDHHGFATPRRRAEARVEKEAIDRVLHGDDASHVLHCRVPIDVIGKSLEAMGDFPYQPTDTTFSGPTLFVRGTQSE